MSINDSASMSQVISKHDTNQMHYIDLFQINIKYEILANPNEERAVNPHTTSRLIKITAVVCILDGGQQITETSRDNFGGK